MRAWQDRGKIVLTTQERDEFGGTYFCDRQMDMKAARTLRDELTAAITVCESMAGTENGVHVGTD